MSGRGHDYIALALPMPVTVMATLGDLMEKAWPGASIITNPRAAGVPEKVLRTLPSSGQHMLVRIDRRAPKPVSKRAAQQIADENARADDDTYLTEPINSKGEFALSAPERLLDALAPIVEAILTNDAGPNYLEMPVRHPDHGEAVITVSRSQQQTPHALRAQAEARIERARALLDDPDALTPDALRAALA